jgi:lysophospholipase L1-like esterase
MLMKLTKSISLVSLICIISLSVVSCSQLDKNLTIVENNNISQNTTYLEYLKALESNEIVHVAIGDSVVKGVGAENGNNYVTLVSERISKITGKIVNTENAGINGLTSSELLTIVNSGKLDEQIENANLITINIGGNDLLRITTKNGILEVAKMFQDTKGAFEQNLDSILCHIQTINFNAKVVVLEQYNPISKGNSLDQLADKLLDSWNKTIYDVVSDKENIAIAKITNVINHDEANRISEDGIHPNENGYKAISEVVYATLHSAEEMN